MTAAARPDDRPASALSVAEAKARFSELIERVGQGERFVVYRRSKPAVALVPPTEGLLAQAKPSGLLTIVGGLADWAELDAVIDEIYASRTRARDREPPELA